MLINFSSIERKGCNFTEYKNSQTGGSYYYTNVTNLKNALKSLSNDSVWFLYVTDKYSTTDTDVIKIIGNGPITNQSKNIYGIQFRRVYVSSTKPQVDSNFSIATKIFLNSSNNIVIGNINNVDTIFGDGGSGTSSTYYFRYNLYVFY